jgi:alkylation response protein AidB-like acyl-CoA dehydrogenase
MDFRFTAEEEALRAEATEFVRQEWEHNDKDAYSMIVASYDVDDVDEEERMHAYAKKLAEKGWFTMHWPKEFGGWGAPLSTQLAYREAMAYAGSPEILGGGMFAPMLMMHGADWQRDFFLPRIASGEIHHLSQGFSEPNAGSDLANVQTRATEDGDDFVLNGQKNLELRRTMGGLGPLPGSHRPHSAQAPRHLLLHHRYERPWYHAPTAVRRPRPVALERGVP